MAYVTLHDRLRGPIVKALQKELGRQNILSLPRLKRVTVNTGINKSKMDSKEVHEYVQQCMTKITGQKAVFTKTNKAISNFKTRKGLVVGCMVTLRGRKMEEFLDRLLSYGLPRIRDFRGVSAKLDGRGNYSIGLRDHSVFPEIAPPEARQIFGLQIVITTTAKNDAEGFALLKEMGMPFKKDKKSEQKAAKAVASAKAATDTPSAS